VYTPEEFEKLIADESPFIVNVLKTAIRLL
jgi:hypothetical protein